MTLAKKLMDCIKYENSQLYIKQMDELGELEQVLPITKEMKRVGECKYHILNCFEHSLEAVRVFEEIISDNEFFDSHINNIIFKTLNQEIDDKLTKRDIIKLGIFLHDIGKPLAMTVDDNNRIHFKKHEILGANEIFQIGSKLGLSKRNINLLYKYIRYHMTLLEIYRYNDMSKENLFSIFEKLKDESIDIFLIGYADIVSTRRLIKPEEDIGVIKSYMTYGITNYIYRYSRI